MEKILFVATVDEHIRHFHYPVLGWFKNHGYEVHVASRGEEELDFVDTKHNISFERYPFKLSNFKAYRELKKLIKDNDYKLVHCHTPVGGVLTRLACISERKKGLKVIYTAHGFHFCKKGPKRDWILYYPIEKVLSRFTDVLIVINEEDYRLALKKNFKAKRIEYIKGVGVNLQRFTPQTSENKQILRKKYSYKESDFILIYVAELGSRKNQYDLLEGIGIVKKDIPNIKLLLVGEGKLYPDYKELIKNMGLEESVQLMGYRKDISELLKLSDLGVSTSKREGLPISIEEAMATGLPLVVSNCRGNRDLVIDGENGFVFDLKDLETFKVSIIELYLNRNLANRFGQKSVAMINQYSIDSILKEMEEIYLSLLEKQ